MMNKRKERVIKKAHELFLANGYHATSIHEIIHQSEISKGSFYNYFTSKVELLKAVLSSVTEKAGEERDALLIGEDPADVGIFIRQVVIVLELHMESRFSQLLEDAQVSNEPELTDFIRKINYKFMIWVHHRFLDIFPDKKMQPYLVDGALLFNGIMLTLMRFNKTVKGRFGITELIEYAIRSVQTILNDACRDTVQMFTPEDIAKLSVDSEEDDFFNSQFSLATMNLRKTIEKNLESDPVQASTCLKLIHFIQDELFTGKAPRDFLIESALLSLDSCRPLHGTQELEQYKKVVTKLL